MKCFLFILLPNYLSLYIQPHYTCFFVFLHFSLVLICLRFQTNIYTTYNRGDDKDQIKTDPTPWIDMEICLFFFSKFVYFNHKIHLKIIYNWLISYHYRKIIVICLNRKILSIIYSLYIVCVLYETFYTKL